MNILIIGNGFDLTHGLPTKYKDFLEFIMILKKSYEYEYNKIYKDILLSDDKKVILKEFIKSEKLSYEYYAKNGQHLKAKYVYIKEELNPIDLCIDLFKKKCENQFNLEIKDSNQNLYNKYKEYNPKLEWLFFKENLWLEYFYSKIKPKTTIGENWIDLESEIAKVIKCLEENEKNPKQPLISFKDLKKIGELFKYNNAINIEGREKYIKKLEDDLNNFIDCLELYILLFDDNILLNDIFIEKIIFSKIIDTVISFNYTNTYCKIVKNVDVDFIHGKAGEHNLVLGIDETIEKDEDIKKDISCIRFKKYFQRIHKKTGLKYKDWLENANDKKLDGFFNNSTADKIKHNICIFGHSLDVTDKDILNYIILHKNVGKTTIYYHNEEAYAQQIANLVKVIDKDKLIEFVGDKKIEFIKQSDDKVKI